VHLALVTDYWLPTLGGVQTAVRALQRSLVAAGHEATVLAPLDARPGRRGPDGPPGTGPGVVALPAARGFRPDGYPFAWSPSRLRTVLRDEFERLGVDVVHTHSEMFAALGAIRAARDLGLPVVHTMHGRIDTYTTSVLPAPAFTVPLLAALHARQVDHRGLHVAPDAAWTSTRARRLMWRVMLAQSRAVDHVLVPSRHFARKLVDQGVDTPVTVLSNGIEADVLARVGEPRVRVPRPGEPLRALWVGRLSPEKRPDVFAEAARLAGDDVVAEAIGDGLARRSLERGGAPVRWRGALPHDDVLAAMARSDVLVSSSLDFDNQPMVLLEAVASGLPVVHCDPDLAEVVPDGGGFASPTPDATGLAAVLSRLRHDPEAVAAASRAVIGARGRVEQRVDDVLAVYRSLAP